MHLSSKQIGLQAANNIPALLAYWDKDEICRFANTTYLEWYGKSQDEMIDKISKKELLGTKYPEHAPYVKAVLKGITQSFDIEIITPDGRSRHSLATYTPDIKNDVVIGFTAHIIDITVRKELELSNIKSDKLINDLLESAPDAIVIVDSTGSIKIVNQQAKNIFGYSRREMVGKEIEFLIPQEHHSKHKGHIKKYFKSATIRPMGKGLKLYGKRKNGERFRVEVSLSPTETEDGVLVMASVRDISDRIRIETELEESNKRNSIFIQQAPNAIAMFDKDMRYIAASQRWFDDYGLTEVDIIGKSHYDIFPEIGEDWKQKHQRCLKGEINQCDEAPFDRADGTRQWITWDVRPWYLTESEIGGLLIYTADITQIKNKEQEKKRVEDILNKTNEIARIGTWEFKIEEEKHIWSKITKEILEVAEDYVPDLESGINFYKVGESRDKITRSVSEAIKNGTSYDIEVELITALGKEIWIRAIGQSEFVNGKCKRLYGIFQDISTIKKAELNLNRVNEELKAMLNSTTVSVVGTDINGLITHFNKGAENMLQYDKADMIGKNLPILFHDKDEVQKLENELTTLLHREIKGFDVLAECAKHTEYNTREWTYIKKNGEKLAVLMGITAMKNHNGEIFGYLGVATDISERVESEKKLQESKEHLELLTEKLTSQNMQLVNFANITSHNLRSPVNNLNSLLHFYYLSKTQEDKNVIIEKFDTVIHHLTETLDTLLETLKIREEGSKKIETIKFSTVLKKTKEMLVGNIMEDKVDIIADFSKAPNITYNRSYLESIFLNLISNAIKYKSPDRTPVITIQTAIEEDRTIFTITDNGLGIDMHKYGKKLFGLHKTFHKHAESKGVGLFLTKNQVTAMGGTITAKSEVGKGTTFKIRF